jgi:hypothetical protein
MNTVPTLLWDDSPRVRHSDPITSHEAADSTNVRPSHWSVVWYLTTHGPSAQWEAEKFLRSEWSPSRVRSAFSELEALGKVRRTDEFRQTPSGQRAQVWTVA